MSKVIKVDFERRVEFGGEYHCDQCGSEYVFGGHLPERRFKDHWHCIICGVEWQGDDEAPDPGEVA